MSAHPQSSTGYGTGETSGDGSFGRQAEEMGSQAKEMGSQAKEKVMSSADTGMDKAAEGLGSAAEKMRMRADEDTGMRSSLETRAADAMDKTSTYLRDHDSEQLMHDIEDFVRQHPLQAAAGALVAGYVIGKIVR